MQTRTKTSADGRTRLVLGLDGDGPWLRVGPAEHKVETSVDMRQLVTVVSMAAVVLLGGGVLWLISRLLPPEDLLKGIVAGVLGVVLVWHLGWVDRSQPEPVAHKKPNWVEHRGVVASLLWHPTAGGVLFDELGVEAILGLVELLDDVEGHRQAEVVLALRRLAGSPEGPVRIDDLAPRPQELLEALA